LSLKPGDRIGPYEVLGHLGSGGMGDVYRARDDRLRRDVALKVLAPRMTEHPEALSRFQSEARATSALSHPNIVTVYDTGVGDSGPYLAMELVSGRTLRTIFDGRSMPFAQLLDVAIHVADALAAAHECGIVHRDLKPENVMVTPERRAKLLDFGLARLTTTPDGSTMSLRVACTQPGTILGTVGYMSPEQVEGRVVDARSDVFSFGAVLYEMATGRRAFAKRVVIDTLEAILSDHPEKGCTFGSDVPHDLEWILGRCLTKDPAGRYGSTRDLVRDLERVRDKMTGAAKMAKNPAPRPARWLLPTLAVPTLVLGIGIGRAFLARPVPAPPLLTQITFRQGSIGTARFAPDGETVVLAASRSAGSSELFSTRPGNAEPMPLGLPSADLAAVSRAGQAAIRLRADPTTPGLLAIVPLGGVGLGRCSRMSWPRTSPRMECGWRCCTFSAGGRASSTPPGRS
jgi:hypothetical protein